MHFGIIGQLQCLENIGYIGLICLKILVVSVWVPVWMYAKRQGCKWNISVLKSSLKPGFVALLTNFNGNENIGNNRLICLKMLVVPVWIRVWMCAKRQDCEWNISVLKNSLKIGFEFRFQIVKTSCGAMFGITKNMLLVSSAVWNFLW